jgi:hypothetical protein
MNSVSRLSNESQPFPDIHYFGEVSRVHIGLLSGADDREFKRISTISLAVCSMSGRTAAVFLNEPALRLESTAMPARDVRVMFNNLEFEAIFDRNTRSMNTMRPRSIRFRKDTFGVSAASSGKKAGRIETLPVESE